MASASRQASKHPAQQREPGLIGRTLNLVGQILLWLVAALLFSLIAEWVGMTWIWPDQGIQHSQQMLEREIGYLNEDFRKSMLTSNPADFARSFADMSYRLIFEYTGIHSLVECSRSRFTPKMADSPTLCATGLSRWSPMCWPAWQSHKSSRSAWGC